MATDIFITHAVTVCTCYALLSLKTHLYGLNWMRCGGAGTASGCQRPGAIANSRREAPGALWSPYTVRTWRAASALKCMCVGGGGVRSRARARWGPCSVDGF